MEVWRYGDFRIIAIVGSFIYYIPFIPILSFPKTKKPCHSEMEGRAVVKAVLMLWEF